MKYSDVANLSGIIQNIERLTDLGQGYISGDATRLKEMTSIINNVNHRVWHLIFMSTGNWQYDDGNNTDLPQSTIDLVSGQAKYALPDIALTVQRIEAKDISGLWTVLTPLTTNSIGQAVDEFMKDNGPLLYYRLLNNTIELFPAPNYASTNGLKVYFDRDSVDFDTSDTTKTPGFASPYHEILPIYAAIEWLKVKQPQSPTLAILLQDAIKLEKSIKEFYGRRFKAMLPKIGRMTQHWK